MMTKFTEKHTASVQKYCTSKFYIPDNLNNNNNKNNNNPHCAVGFFKATTV